MTDFEKIGASAPVDASAARQLARGETFDFKTSQYTFLSPPPLKDLRRYQNQEGFVDLTGETIGRLVVLGLWDRTGHNPKSIGRWVCRCQCGKYCAIRSKPLKRKTTDRCSECRRVQEMREGKLSGGK